MRSTEFRVGLDWVHGIDTVTAEIPYGEIRVSQARDGKWEIEINGEVLRARPNHKDKAMELASDIFSQEIENWLYGMTNAPEVFS